MPMLEQKALQLAKGRVLDIGAGSGCHTLALQEKGLVIAGTLPDDSLVEMIEVKDHPWFVATQAHPELKSRPNNPHPLFRDFIKAALAQ